MEQQPSLLKEIRTHGTGSFPCANYRTHFKGKGRLIKHHWHDEAEILYFSGGKFRLEINMEAFLVESECLYFINPGELHSIMSETSESHWEDAVVFSTDIMRSFGQMAQEDSLAVDSSLVTNDLTSQLYIKSSLLYIIATLSGSGLFVPTERNMDKRVESIKTALTYIRENYREFSD